MQILRCFDPLSPWLFNRPLKFVPFFESKNPKSGNEIEIFALFVHPLNRKPD